MQECGCKSWHQGRSSTRARQVSIAQIFQVTEHAKKSKSVPSIAVFSGQFGLGPHHLLVPSIFSQGRELASLIEARQGRMMPGSLGSIRMRPSARCAEATLSCPRSPVSRLDVSDVASILRLVVPQVNRRAVGHLLTSLCSMDLIKLSFGVRHAGRTEGAIFHYSCSRISSGHVQSC